MKAPMLLLLAVSVPAVARAQLIPVKTSPIVTGNQLDFLPSDNRAAGAVSIALPDTLHDPFENPALGARLGRGSYFGAPSMYALANNAGNGATLPIGMVRRYGALFGGVAVAVQTIGPAGERSSGGPVPVALGAPSGTTLVSSSSTNNATNRYATGLLGARLPDSSIAVGIGASYAQLNGMDGADLLFANSSSFTQRGRALNLRAGAVKSWAAGGALSVSVVSDHYDMTQDARGTQFWWDPNTRQTVSSPIAQHNAESRQAWGAGLNVTQPLADSAWRLGAMFIGNRITHPIVPAGGTMDIAGDPTTSNALNIGVGVARATATTRVGLDAIYEPIWSRGFKGGPDTTDRTTFSNVVVRTGFTQTIPLTDPRRFLVLRVGLGVRAVHYRFSPSDTTTGGTENWTEWTPTWGIAYHSSDVVVHLTWRQTSGLGRPGSLVNNTFGFVPTINAPITSGNSTGIVPVDATVMQLTLTVPVP